MSVVHDGDIKNVTSIDSTTSKSSTTGTQTLASQHTCAIHCGNPTHKHTSIPAQLSHITSKTIINDIPLQSSQAHAQRQAPHQLLHSTLSSQQHEHHSHSHT